uniref:DUF2950 domain-containing protein n=1 Tax=Solibacter usitatus (strain Ellin6076) TaxID=234267 RepID=Q01WY0_SOLUE
MTRLSAFALAAAGVVLLNVPVKAATPDGRAFPSADAAAQALVDAAKSDDTAALIEILGPSARGIVTTRDSVADRNSRKVFTARAAEKMRLVASHGNPKNRTLVVGKDEWPLPIPIVERNGQWYFDTAQGREEILTRRIGSNELDAIEVCRGFVEAENQYAEKNRTANHIPIYAQMIISSPGERDGLYWDAKGEGDESPIGEIVARALAQGYTNKHEPYRGYYFKVLTAQGPSAAGGEKSYIKDGVMTRGFALIAWPANYGSTGMMTFVVDKSGIVYQKDLGPKTGEVASGYAAYDPDHTWHPVSDATRP